MRFRPKQLKLLLLMSVPLLVETMMSADAASAATFSLSQGEVFVDTFSHQPQGVSVIIQGEKEEFSAGGSVSLSTEGKAIFDAFPGDRKPTQSFNFSKTEGRGSGPNYWGEAISQVLVSGLNFNVKAGDKFTFRFHSLITTIAEIQDRRRAEQAIADGSLNFAVVDVDKEEVLDSFTVRSRVNTAGDDDFHFFETDSDHLWWGYASDTSVGMNREYMYNRWFGTYNRTFKTARRLTFVELKQNYSYVKAPEPSAIAGLLLLTATAAGISNSRKRKSLDV